MVFPISQTFPRTKRQPGPLLTTRNLDRMAPPKPKNPYRIQIWAFEVSVACCESPQICGPQIDPPTWWRKVLRRNSSSSSKSKKSFPANNLNELGLGMTTISPGNASFKSNKDEDFQTTAMYQAGPDVAMPGTKWGCDDYEPTNAESSLDIASSSSGVGWGDRAARLEKAEKLLNTDSKKSRFAALRNTVQVDLTTAT